MSRRLSDWLSAYMEYTNNQEAPEVLHYWVGYSMVSAAVRRQVYLDRFWYNLYPNLFVLVVAESGKLRKSVAVNLGMSILKEAVPDAMVMSGRMTPEGLIKNLNVVKHERNKAGTVVKRNPSTVLVHADELATLFGYDRQAAARMAILLTELYGCPDEYTHTTARDGVVDIREAYVSLLAATAPQNFKVMPEETVGGLLGRLVIVAARDKKNPIAWGQPSPHHAKIREALVADLYEMSLLEGPLLINKDAMDLFAEWYNRQQEITFKDARLDAFHERCHDTALKIAMLTCIARSNEKLILPQHVQHGITTIERLLPNHARIMEWTSNTPYGQHRVKFIDLLVRAGGRVGRPEAVRIMGLPLEEFDMLVRTMKEEGTLKPLSKGQGGEEVYELARR